MGSGFDTLIYLDFHLAELQLYLFDNLQEQ
jgi:hypothetical protein